jgi:hypothetical protein
VILQQSQADAVPLIINHHPTHDSNNDNNNKNNNNNNNNEDNRLHQLASAQKLLLGSAFGLFVSSFVVMVSYIIGYTTTPNTLLKLIFLSEVVYCGACVSVNLIGLFCTICL